MNMTTPPRGKAVGPESSEKSPRNFRWTQNFEDTLLELLVRESRNGNRPDSSFTATAFRNVIKDFNQIHGTTIVKKNILSRIKTMKSRFVMFHAAFNALSGFSWNHETKMFEAEDYLWEQRIKENPRFAKFRDRTCYSWDKLFELYGGARATGAEAINLTEKAKILKRGLAFGNLGLDTWQNDDEYNPNTTASSYGDHEVSMGDTTPRSTPELGSTQQSGGTTRDKLRKKSTLEDIMEEGYKTMAASIKDLSMALVGSGEKVASSKFDVSQHGQIFETLEALALNEDYKVRCYFHLSANPTMAALLIAAPPGIRAKLLQDIMKNAESDN